MFNKVNCTIAVANGRVALMTESQVTANSKDMIWFWSLIKLAKLHKNTFSLLSKLHKITFSLLSGENRSNISEGPAQDGRRSQISGVCFGKYYFLKMLRLYFLEYISGNVQIVFGTFLAGADI